MKNKNTKTIVFGALMVALTAVLMVVSRYIPLFSVFGTFVCGIPMAVFAAKYDFRALVPTVIAVFAVSVVIDGNFISAASVLLLSIVPGATAGYMLGKNRPFFISLFGTCLAVCVGWLFQLFVIEVLMDQGINEIFGEVLKQTEAVLTQTIGQIDKSAMNSSATSPEEILKLALETTEFVMRLYFPFLVVLSSMITGYIIIRVSGFVIKRTGSANIRLVPFSEIKAPRSMSFVALLCYMVYVFTDEKSNMWPVLANVVAIIYTIIGVSGLSVVDFKLKAKVPSGGLRFLIYALVFFLGSAFMSIIYMILIVIGITDASRNFRQIGIDGEEA